MRGSCGGKIEQKKGSGWGAGGCSGATCFAASVVGGRLRVGRVARPVQPRLVRRTMKFRLFLRCAEMAIILLITVVYAGMGGTLGALLTASGRPAEIY